jgi:hypothetical protein
MELLMEKFCRKWKWKSLRKKVSKSVTEIVCVKMEVEIETGKCLWLRCVKMLMGATTHNSGFAQWLLYLSWKIL